MYDYLRLLFARIGIPHDPETGEELVRQTPQQIVDKILTMEEGLRFQVLAPVVKGRKGTYDTLLADFAGQGFVRAIVDGQLIDLNEEYELELERYETHDISVVVDRLVLREGIERRLTDSIETALNLTVASPNSKSSRRRVIPRRSFQPTPVAPSDGKSFDELAPRNFSFNSPYGACSHCDGLGTVFEVDARLVIPDQEQTIAGGAIQPWAGGRSRYFSRLVESICELYEIPQDLPWEKLSKKQRDLLLHGRGVKGRVQVRYKNRYGRTRTYQARYEGVIPYLMRRHDEAESDATREQIEGYMRQVPCQVCSGARLNPLSLAVTIDGHNISDLCSMSIADAAKTLGELELNDRDAIIAEQVLKEINARLGFLLDVGLDYLSMSRNAATLAGGEAQRIRLASQVGSGLVGVLYVLDEPSIGLHQRDNQRLIETLVRMRDLGNTVLVVEHDEDSMKVADHIVDIGPGAGEHGGTIVHSGTYKQLLKNKESITGQYLSGKRSIPVPGTRRPGNGNVVTVVGAEENNLQDVSVEFPLGKFVCVTGVSGSGKSTLVNEILLRSLMQRIYTSKVPPGLHKRFEGMEQLDKVIAIDQSPIGRTLVRTRDLHGSLRPHSQAVRPNQRGQHSWLPAGPVQLQREGRTLRGLPGRRHDQDRDALPPGCLCSMRGVQGKRYNRDTLEIMFKGKNIAEVLAMPIEEALEFFSNQPPIARHMQTLVDVGLGYVRLGQPAPTLSGGEASG